MWRANRALESERPRLLYILGLTAVLAAAGVVAADRAAKQRIGTDFHVFWQAGYDFAQGLPLYQPLPGARAFIYPPFAAQVFQLLSLFPLKVAAGLFYVASVGLIVAAVALSRDIVGRLQPSRHRALPIVLALLFSAVFIIDNLDHVQVNLLTFLLCLLGIRAFLSKREAAAGGWIMAATAIKLTPVFFALWAAIRGTRRTLAAVGAFSVLTLILPMIQRGFRQGVIDLNAYYQAFLHQFAAGEVVTNYRNQNLAAMVYRAVVPGSSGDTSPYDYAYLASLEGWAPLLYRVLAVGILAVFLLHLIRLRTAAKPIGSLEISSVFLASHLLSGITWKAHLVTLLFVFYAFFSLDRQRMSRAAKLALGLAWAGIVAVGLGRDVIGSRLHHYWAGYSVFVWVMLLLFTLSIAWSQRQTVGPEPVAPG
jgi:glycosyl transferase family 87